MANEKVLLVDDEQEFTQTLSERMESRGLQVVTAENGPTALRKAEEESFDAIILDIMMPGMDGIETLRRLREINPKLQVIMLTGHATVKTGIEATKLGALDFLEKPADIKQLLEKIDQAKTNKMLLVEEENEEKIKKILKSKGW
ncbi:MAG: response regulator [Candidatus Abyssobacteria bacterium SURF_5]|uniref:Response regulator n=1 Tax=Abyssobacteria bacterium (strain SURF_5) TaxID=2093360 RepID=A0A3A4N8C5_ABYX5|nr:MAG: response regulator [Candidatus Abyssubacteria bacterium SURF_5]